MRRRDLLLGLGSLALVPGARPGHAALQETTPAPGAPPDSFGGMLALAPDILASADPAFSELVRFANPALQFATTGQPPGGEFEEVWQDTINPWIRLPWSIGDRAHRPPWRAAFGFEARQLDQALAVVAGSPDLVLLLRGRFALDELRAAWAASGYAPVDVPGAEAYSWAAEVEIDTGVDISALALGSMNNAAILPDGAVVFTGSLAMLQRTVAAARGETATLGARPDVAALVAGRGADWTTGFLLTGEAIRPVAPEAVPVGNLPAVEAARVADLVAARRERWTPLPRPDLLAVGVTAGGPLPDPNATSIPLPPGTPRAVDSVVVRYADQAAAAAAAPIVAARLANEESLFDGPFHDIFAAWDIAVDAAEPVLSITLETAPEQRPGRAIDLLFGRDLFFIEWRA